MSAETESFPRAEEMLRLLATAAGTARLYPPSSAMPAEAIRKFAQRSNEVTRAQGPLRYSVDPDAFRIGETEIASGNVQVSSFAKALHALQVGQIVIAPGLTDAEATAFITIANADPAAVRAVGGPRAVLGSAHVSHIAVVEVSLRASEEEGLAGIDLMSAPLGDIAQELAEAAQRWAQTNGASGDEMASAIGHLETATRDIAIERVASALMRLDEQTRMKVLAYALQSDSTGRRMDGMLDVMAHLKPAALSRLLTLVATQAGTDPNRLGAALPLAPEAAALLKPLLSRPVSIAEEEEQAPSAQEVATDMAQVEDQGDIQRQVAIASPQLSASRALTTAVAVSRLHADEESVRAIGETLPQAARDGGFATVREALRRLDELSSQPGLTVEIGQARAMLSEPEVLAEVCSAVITDADAAIAGEILHASGPAGAEALLEAFIRGTDIQRSLLRPAMRGMSESILGVARARLRSEEPSRAIAILSMLPALGDRRAVPVMSQALAHLDEQVRFAAVSALADTRSPEAANALVKALSHPEPETQRFVVREIGRVKAAPAVHELTRALEDLNVLQRTYETKKEVIRALAQIGTPEAQRALRRTADRTFAVGRKSRELRSLARRALTDIDTENAASTTEGVDLP